MSAFTIASTLFFGIMLLLGSSPRCSWGSPVRSWACLVPGFDDDPALTDLTVSLAQLMFPIVVLLALSGVTVGMLNSFGHFSVPALAPIA